MELYRNISGPWNCQGSSFFYSCPRNTEENHFFATCQALLNTPLSTGGPSSQCYPFFSLFYANVQANVTYGMYYYITTEFDHAKHDSRLAVYGGVMLQRFEFIKVFMGMQRLCLKSQLFLYRTPTMLTSIGLGGKIYFWQQLLNVSQWRPLETPTLLLG